MRHEVAYADSCLGAWASWVRGNPGAWPRRTLLARIMAEGTSGASQGAPVETMPLQVMQTDRAVAKLPKQMSNALKAQYLTHASSEVKAASVGLTRHKFLKVIERAQMAVYYRLHEAVDSFRETAYSQATLQIVSS